MAKPEWGLKRLCPACSANYYDLGQMPPVCPNCGTPYDPEALLRSRRRPGAIDEPAKRPAAGKALEDAEATGAEAEAPEAGDLSDDTLLEDEDAGDDTADDDDDADVELADEGDDDENN